MNKQLSEQPAILPNLSGKHLPPVTLAISADFQCCVDAGARSAAYFLEGLTNCSLHDHIAASSRVFIKKVQCLLAAQGDNRPFNQQRFVDAFVAGYFGLIQQELSLLHGEKNSSQSSQPVSEISREGACQCQ